MSTSPIPTSITLHKASRTLELTYDDQNYPLPFEFLRVLSPSAEVRGHGPGQETLQTGCDRAGGSLRDSAGILRWP